MNTHYKKKNSELNHLSCVIKISDTILHYLFSNEINIHNLKSVITIDVFMN